MPTEDSQAILKRLTDLEDTMRRHQHTGLDQTTPLSGGSGSNRSAARAYLDAAPQEIASTDGITVIEYDAESYDTTHKFTAQEEGKYQVNALVELNSLAANKTMYGYIYKNDAAHAQSRILLETVGDAMVMLSDIVELAAGDYIDIRLQHDSGAAPLYIGTGSAVNYVSIHKLS
jgi:hypothetical protein